MTKHSPLVLLLGASFALGAGCEGDDDVRGGGTPVVPPDSDTDTDADTDGDTDDDTDTDGPAATRGLLGAFVLSGVGPEDEQVTAEIGRVEIRKADSDAYIVVTEAAGSVIVSESQARQYPLGEQTLFDVTTYDAVRLEILGGTLLNAAGEEFAIDAYDGELLLVNGRFCIQGAEPTQVDLELGATASSVSSTSWTFNFDPVLRDHRSCGDDPETDGTIDEGTVGEDDDDLPL